jgi:quinolinate synthase
MPTTYHSALVQKINDIKKTRNAVLVAHNFQSPEIQDIADFVGDTLEVIGYAAATKADVIVVCGVMFMAETASILCPDKTILLPDPNATCPMANMITREELAEKKTECPDALVLCYLNTPADVKADSDVCCTADNAVEIVKNLPADREILFIPDLYLGDYISSRAGREMILWPGYCPTHSKIMPEDVAAQKAKYPAAKVAAHPECSPLVRASADIVANSGGILQFARETDATEIIVATEVGILHRLRRENPGKTFIPASEKASCGKMKRTNLETVYWALEDMTTRITLPDDVRDGAARAISKMLELSSV